MEITKFKINKETAAFINAFSILLTTKEGNTYLQIPAIFKVAEQGTSLEVIDKDTPPQDLVEALTPKTEDNSKPAEITAEELANTPDVSPENFVPEKEKSKGKKK